MVVLKKGVVLAVIGIAGLMANVNATMVTANITADNHYALYIGNSNGIELIGNNELGYYGNPGSYNWSLPENFNFELGLNQDIFIAAWGDNSGLQGLIGDFNVGGTTVVTNNTDWTYVETDFALNDNLPPPDVSIIQGIVASNPSWQSIGSSQPNGYLWGTVPGISADANWIWGTSYFSGNFPPNVQVFKMNPISNNVPEPALFQLLGIGLLGLAAFFRKRR